MTRTGGQTVDPAVSQAKFQRELDEYAACATEYRRRGWWLLRAEFPEVVVAMVTPRLSPAAVVTAVKLDYTNYDEQPPSLRLVDPFTEEPYTYSRVPTVLKRLVEHDLPAGFAPMPAGPQAKMLGEQPLLQGDGPDDIPFLCVAGVREYHEHSAHSADRWEHHRAEGAGRLVRLLEIIDTYGVRPIINYNVGLQVVGFQQEQPPK